MFSGPYELIIIAFIALLLFGSRLPNMMRSVGESIKEFKTGLNSATDDASLP